MPDYAACLAHLAVSDPDNYGNAEWGTAITYADIVRTWTDARPLPSKAKLDALWPAVQADIALIDDMPTKDELDGVMLGVITGVTATTILNRRVAALDAKTRIP